MQREAFLFSTFQLCRFGFPLSNLLLAGSLEQHRVGIRTAKGPSLDIYQHVSVVFDKCRRSWQLDVAFRTRCSGKGDLFA
jgi:hypothetical protein